MRGRRIELQADVISLFACRNNLMGAARASHEIAVKLGRNYGEIYPLLFENVIRLGTIVLLLWSVTLM